MSDYTIFYSWQTDAPETCNKALIRKAIQAVVKDPDKIKDSPRYDSGMDNAAGSPEVATMMFEKIKDSAIFVGDVTLVGEVRSEVDGKIRIKKIPNPNVSVEMGYAAAVVGWDRIICVMNEAPSFGTREQQPFDVKNRRFPIDYVLTPEDATDSKKEGDALKELTKWMRKAIETVEANELRKVERACSRLDLRCLDLIHLLGPRFDSFPEPTPKTIKEFPLLGMMDRDRFNGAVERLLDLDVLFTDHNPKLGTYAYHWTYLGKKVLKWLNIRKDIPS